MTPSVLLQKLRDLDRTSPHFRSQLINILRGKEYRDAILSLQGEDLTWFVNYLDNILCDISDHSNVPFREPLDELRKICGIKNVLPDTCTLSDSLLGCVYEDTFNGSKVRVRRVRTRSKGDPQKVNETFRQVTVVWKHLTHPNIVPLLGVTIDPPQLISDRMPGGNLTEYIADHPDTDRIGLLSNVAEGLNYLHSRDIIHGDLKGSNILVDASGDARLTDFGLAMVTQDLDSIRSGSDEYGDSVRWIAPEILGGRGTHSKEGDVFSFAMVTIEVFTGTVPFSDIPSRAAMSAIIGGERPSRPANSDLTDKLWALVRRCWDQDAHRRPNVLWISCSLCSNIPGWKHLIDSPLTTDERVSLIAGLFSDRDETESLKGLGGGDAQSFIDVIHEALDVMTPRLRRKCLAILCNICGHHGLIPRAIQIPLCYNQTEAPRYRGGFAEVWKGEYEGIEVAAKVLKVFTTSDLIKITKILQGSSHLECSTPSECIAAGGVTMSDDQFAMVSEWMANGNINEFVKTHRDVNRFKLLEDVTQGLMYIHSQMMIHGDLKGANIMIDKDSNARLADFGLLTIVSDLTQPATTTPSEGAGTMRWMSPELLDPERFGCENGLPTKESDCYALGMVTLEVLTGKAPFSGCSNMIVMRKIVEGEHPDRPQGPEAVWFTDDLWGVLEQCWSPKLKLRPTVEGILERLGHGSATWKSLPLSADGESQVNSDDDLFFTTSHHSSVEAVPQDGSKPPAVSQHYPGGAGTDQGSSQPSPEIQQQLGESLQPQRPSSPTLRPPPHSTTYELIQRLGKGSVPKLEVLQVLSMILHANDYKVTTHGLPEDDLRMWVEALDQILVSRICTTHLRRWAIRALRKTCGSRRILPRSHYFPGRLFHTSNRQVGGGGANDVWQVTDDRNHLYAAKVFRSYERDDHKIKRYYKEVATWKRLNHPNLLPTAGAGPDIAELCVVFPWMPDGHLLQYLSKHPGVDRVAIAVGIASGFCCLHYYGAVHGDLKGENILFDNTGIPRISNFGSTPLTINPASMNASTPTRPTSIRWTAPEILEAAANNEAWRPTRMSDVYAFGMVVVEIFTGRYPFPDDTDLSVQLMVGEGKRPPKPADASKMGLSSTMWGLVEDCWNKRRDDRPEIQYIAVRLPGAW